MTRYPYDPTGKAVTNAFTEERILESNENTDRVIMLDHAPFFGALEIYNGNSASPLDEGSDYEYVYELTALKNALAPDAAPVYCGVQFINPDIAGTLTFKGNLLGGDFYDPLTEILDYLIKYINNPRTADYRSLNGVPSLFPQKPSYTSWADAKNKQYAASAIDDVRVAMEDDLADEKGQLAELTRLANQLYTDIEVFNYPGHIAATDPHHMTTAQLNAHPVGLEVPDTFLAYGMTMRELIENIRSQGLTDATIQTYIHRYLSKNVKGSFFFADGSTVIADSTGNTKLILGKAKIQLITQGGVVAAAGTDLSGGKYVEYVCGTNTLRINTNGNKLGVDMLLLNGVALLTGRTVKQYQSEDQNGDPENVQINIQSTNIGFTGKGTPSAPLQGTLTIPKASNTVAGKVKLVSGTGAAGTGVAATPDSGKPFNDGFNNMVTKTTLINNKPMTGTEIILDKSDLNLSSVDNTADVNKPLSTPQKDRTDALVNKNHTHDWSMLEIGQATSDTYGTVKIANTLSEVEDGQAVAPFVLKGLADRLTDINKRFIGVMFRDTLEFTSVEAVTFGINGYVLAPLTQYRYFVARSLDSAEGTFDGSVDLTQVPADLWHTVGCGVEKSWKVGFIHNTQPANPLPQAKAVSSSATKLGAPGLVVAAKVRIRFADEAIKVRVRSSGKVSVWIDENLMADAQDNPEVEFWLNPGAHVISVSALCENTGLPASVAFDVSDGGSLIYNSGSVTKVGEIGQYLPAQNNRFFIYGNVLRGRFQALGSPLQAGAVNTGMIYLGHVDTNDSGVITAGGPVQFGQIIDFGQFKELTEHEDDPDAHDILDPNDPDYSPANVKVIGLENTEPYGVADKAIVGTPDVVLFSSAAGMAMRTQGSMISAVANAAAAIRLWVGVEGQSAYRWRNMANPQEGNKVTYDGSFAFTGAGNLEFIAAAVNGKHEVLSLHAIDMITGTASISFVNEVTPSPLPVPYVPVVRTNLISYTREISKAISGSFNFPAYVDNVSIQKTPMVIVRYRYIPAEKRLNLQVSLVYTADRSEVHQYFSLVFEQDLSRFFNGPYVGYYTETPYTQVKMMGSIFDNSIDATYLNRLNYHRGLMNAYLRGEELATYAASQNGVTRGLATIFLGSEVPGADIATQAILTEQSTGLIRETATYAIPHALWEGSREATFGRTPVVAYDKLNQGDTSIAAVGLANINRRGYLLTHIETALLTNAKSVTYTISGQGQLALWIDAQAIASFGVAEGASGQSTGTINIVANPNFKGYVSLTCAPQTASQACFVKAKLVFTYADNSTRTLVTNTTDWFAYEYGKIPMIAMRNPWNLTQRNLEFVQQQVALEKE